MSVTIELPAEIEKDLTERWGELSQRALEALAIEGYREGVLSHRQLGDVLGMGYWETEGFLKARKVPIPYGIETLRPIFGPMNCYGQKASYDSRGRHDTH